MKKREKIFKNDGFKELRDQDAEQGTKETQVMAGCSVNGSRGHLAGTMRGGACGHRAWLSK